MFRQLIGMAVLVAGAAVFAKDLVWNGGAGGTWNDTSETWLDGAAPCAWEDGATAVFSGSGLVAVSGEIKAGGIRFTSTGTALVGDGLILLDGAVDAAAGTSNSISTRLYANPAMSKTGDGTVSLAYTRGAFAINAGTVYAGGFNMLNTSVTVSPGASLKAVSGGDKAETLLANGSFETPQRSSFTYVNNNNMPTGWTRGSANYVVHMNGAASKNPWNNATDEVPDGNMVLAIQMNGEISQTFTVPADGFYDLSFYMFRRGSYNTHQLYLYMDGLFWQPFYDSLHSSQMASDVVDTGAIWLSAGSHTVKIAGEGYWGDTTTFIDDLVLAAPTLAEAASIPSSSGAVVDVASGEQTFTDTYSLTADGHGFRRLAKTGAGKAVFTQNLAIGGATIYDVEGEAEYAGTITGAQHLHKRGTGALTLTTPGNPVFMLENGSLRVKNFTSSMNVAYRVDQGVTAGFYPGLASGDASIASMTFAGNGTCALGTLGDGRTLTVSGGGTLNTPTVLFDVGEGDTIRFGSLRAELVGNEKTFVDTAIVKTGSGTLELTTAPSCYAPTAFTVREGTLAVEFDDTSYAFSYTPVGKSAVNTNTYGILRTAALPLVLGDRNSPGRSAVTFRMNRNGFTSPRPVVANGQPASVSLDVATGSAALSGTLEVHRSVLNLTGAAGTSLSLGDVTTDEGRATLALDANLALSLDGTLGAGVFVSAPNAADFNVKKGTSGSAAFTDLTLGGGVSVDFDGNGHDTMAVSGTLTLGTTAFTLHDVADDVSFARPGRYVLATFGTFSGDVADLSVANPVAGYEYSFTAANGELALTIFTEESNPVYTWTGGATGNWTDAGNWDHASVPDGADKTAVFAGGAGALTATLQGTATVGGLVCENAGGVALSGGTITFSATDTPVIHAKYGTFTVSSALAGTGPVAVTADAGATVVIDGAVSCDLLLDGVGVALGTNATVAAGATVRVKRAGTLAPAGATVSDAGLRGLMGRYWRAPMNNAQLSLVTDWKAFKAHAQGGTFVTEALMDNAAGFLVDDITHMNFPAELQGDTADANHWIGIWEGYVTIPAAGRYGFRLTCDDHALLAIDGRNVTQCTWNGSNSAVLDLSAGAHRIFAGLYDEEATSKLYVYVRMPDGTEQALPLAWLTPEMSADAVAGTGTLAPETVLTVAPTNGVSSWRGTLDADGALAKTGASAFETKLTKGSLVAAEGLLAATSAGTADGVAVSPGATVALAAGGTVKGLSGGGTFAAGAHAYGFPISNDADCGISSAKTYTHAVNVCGDSYANGVSPVATVNGVTFQNYAAAKGGGKFACNIGGHLSGQARSDYTDPQSGDSGLQLLLRTLGYNGKTNYVQMSGLTPGKVYDFRAYYRPYGNCDRKFQHNFETGGKVVASITWDTNTGGGVSVNDPSITRGYSVVGCRYVAGADGKIVLRTYKVNVADSNGYHIYAFTNEEVADGATGVTLAPEGEGAFEGEVTGDATVTVSGTGSQLFAGGVAAPLAVTGTVILDGGAAATGGVAVAQGGVLEMRPGSTSGALTGAGTVRLAHGEGGLRGALQADGTFAAPAFPQRVFFTGDDDCGISSGKRYAHAWNFGTNTAWATLVNGARLAPFWRNSAPKDGRRFVSMSNNFGGGEQNGSYPAAMGTAFAGTEIMQVLRGMAYGGGKSNEMNFVGGLVAGKEYEVRMYNRAWDIARPRQCIFTCDPFGAGAVQYDFNENDSVTPSYVAFRIRPDGTSFKLVGRSDQTADYPHFYGATIEEVADYARAVDSDEDATFAGAVTGFGSFTKRGAGVQTFSGAVAATGPWTVEAGGLMLANAQASVSNVAVLAGATFGGFGRVTGDLGVAAGGHLALGAAGALEVGGNVVLGGQAELDVAFNADGTGAGALTVAGTLTLPDDLTITLSGAEKPGTRRNVMTASGGITGDYSGWSVKDASGNVIGKARIKMGGGSLSLILDQGSLLIFR